MLETVIGWVTGHIADVIGPVLATVAALGAGWKMGRDGAIKAAQGAVLEKTDLAAKVSQQINATSDDELTAKAKEWTR